MVVSSLGRGTRSCHRQDAATTVAEETTKPSHAPHVTHTTRPLKSQFTELRTGLDSTNPYNPVPDKRMAEEGNFLSESTSSRLWAAGDREDGRLRASATTPPCRCPPTISSLVVVHRPRAGSSCSRVSMSPVSRWLGSLDFFRSSATAVGNGGERYHMTPTS